MVSPAVRIAILGIALLTIAAALPADHAANAAPSPRRGGTLTYASAADVNNFDPALRGGTISEAAKKLVYASLVRETPSREVRADLATSWRVDGTTWTLTLRQGVKFHDGTAFGAQAVKYHYDRLFSAENPQRSSDWRAFLERVDVVDDNTVRFTTRFPDPFFLQRLAASSQIGSPDAHRRLGRDVARNPVGAGPFRLREWTPGVRVVLVRNDDYFGEKAFLDQIIIRPVPEAGARAIALEAGDVQLADLISPEDMPRLQRNRNIALSSRATVRQLTVGLHNLKKPFSDVRVRQALNHAVDRDAIAKGVYQGLADPLPGAVPTLATGFAEVESFEYNPARARTLLAEAGYPNGFSATFIGTKGRYFKDFELMQAIQLQLKQVGVDAKIQSVEWARYLELVNMAPSASPLEMWLDGWSGDRATDILQQRFGCEFFRPRGINLHGYCNKDVDALVNEAVRVLDDARRNNFLRLAQQQIRKDAPSIWGLAVKATAAMSRKLHGVLHFPDETLTVDERTWLEP
jgi:ABC-type transport system substrate-binding protein